MRAPIIATLSLIALTQVSCREDLVPTNIEFDPSTRAALIIALSPDQSVAMQAVDVDAARANGRDFRFTADAQVYVFEYRRTLQELLMEPAEVAEADGTYGLPIPNASRHQRSRTDQATGLQWDLLLKPPVEVASLLVPRGTTLDCVGLGGCSIHHDEGEACGVPCPEPSALLEPEAPRSPEGAALPDFDVCPPGRTREVVDEVPRCKPTEPPLRLTCAANEVQRYAETACSEFGPPCPTDDYTDVRGATPAYVDPAAASGGDGTRALPYRTIALAVDSGATLIALAKGRHLVGPLELDHEVEIVGACPSLTTIAVATQAITTSSTITLRNVEITSINDAVLVQGDAVLTISNVVIRSGGIGVAAYERARVTIEDTLITPTNGEGVVVANDSRATLREVVIDGATNNGLYFGNFVTAEVSRTAIRGTRPGTILSALGIYGDAQVQVEDLELAENTNAGVFVSGANARLNLVHATVRESGIEGGFGFIALVGGFIDARDVVMRRNRGDHFVANNADSMIIVRDVDAEAALGSSGGPIKYAHAMSASDGGTIRATRAFFKGHRAAAAVAVQGRLELTDVVLLDTRVRDGRVCCGRGIELTEAELDVRRVLVREYPHGALMAATSSVALRDLHATSQIADAVGVVATNTKLLIDHAHLDTESRCVEVVSSDGVNIADLRCPNTQASTRGIDLRHVATATIVAWASSGSLSVADSNDLAISDLAVAGIDLAATANTAVSASRLLIRDSLDDGMTLSNVSMLAKDISILDSAKTGFSAEGSTRVSVARIEIVGSGSRGLRAGAGVVIDAIDLDLENTHLSESGSASAFGIDADSGARLSVERLLVRGSDYAAVNVQSAADVDLVDGAIEDSEVAFVLPPFYDLGRLVRNVRLARDRTILKER